eukprot:TRINITY_DN5109_c0_g1_i2.p1 TRINITY_DN5109_c0_g1~~TRINITY_DN5109_c0_g1_i2.p1  ORF type:complete len:469 (+),score=142.61 TRINITY_DN5109_c0_g1_i2:50-1408(+)
MEEEKPKSLLEHIETLLERVPKVSSFDEKVEVDLDMATCEQLEGSIECLKRRLEKRRAEADEGKLLKQLQHLESQLELHEKVPISLPHLEIYRGFLGRVMPPTTELQERASSLKERIHHLINHHPNRAEPRSGDHENTEQKGAIVSVPITRRRQTAAIFFLNFFTGPLLVMSLIFMFWWFFPFLWATVFAVYYAWVYHHNKTRPLYGEGSGTKESYRESVIFKHFCDYFPLRVVKDDPTADYSANSNLFCIHPHGVQCVAIFGFLTKYCGSDVLFPGVHISAQTLPMNFWAPVMREHCIALGCGDASAHSIKKALTWCKGASTGLVVGGAKEAIHAAPHTNKIALKERYGFVKMALSTGASLVPCYSFGENSLYDNLSADRPRIVKWQRRLQRMLTFAPLFVAGRGIFSYSGGLIPHRRPVTTVVGKPIPVEKTDNPSPEMIKEVCGNGKNI